MDDGAKKKYREEFTPYFLFYKKIQCVFVDFPFNDFAIYFFFT